ncbi:unnamed protein product [Prorocentrum cordatum]|uniref:Uncharacterized protein n=1 Tax=Prorocentrum cordatum TaxID=2364126 RepID=A0ABN9Q4D1_9DINO|nr:unnamed protein product [Polarella glacialis]CAK0816221.1 unnamed protein product [Polarella glacialis]
MARKLFFTTASALASMVGADSQLVQVFTHGLGVSDPADPAADPTPAPTCADSTYTITYVMSGSTHKPTTFTYTGPSGLSFDNFATCANTSSASCTMAASTANFCQSKQRVDVRVLRRTDTNEIIRAGTCCSTKRNWVTAMSSQCAVATPTPTNTCLTPSPTPIPAPTPSPTPSPTEAPTSSPTSSPTPSPTSNPTSSPTSSPTASPTSSPSSSPTASPTPSPTSTPMAPPISGPMVAGVGDPHLANTLGQKFDLLQAGYHTLVHIPRWARQRSNFLVEARASRAGLGCADLYFTEINISGTWARRHKATGLRWDAEATRPGKSTWMTFHNVVKVKIVHGRTAQNTKYLNIFLKGLHKTKVPVGGLLGEDDHTAAATPDKGCKRIMTL